MSAQLIIQLTKERDEHSRKAHTYKKALENVSGNLNPETGKPFKNKKEMLEYISKVLNS